jgi:hypothetical protein
MGNRRLAVVATAMTVLPPTCVMAKGALWFRRPTS